MAIVVKYDVQGMDASRYDEIIRQLAAIGQGEPDGRMYHICYGDSERLQVIDVFEDYDRLNAFGQQLLPILQRLGIEVQPEAIEVYNIIEGRAD
ncbi:MAG: hypothetical protein D6715_06085 [Calditrichaeota bacterium]|nr:MAG: hypothetical protein D6715_06085 [Calditrichota bacterium]